MSKVGILTLYHVRNIGACLQAYAMKEKLEAQGNDVFFIKGYDTKFAFQLLKGDVGSVRPWSIPFLLKRELKFQKFFSSFNEASLIESCEFDSIIIGSDSVWIAKYADGFMPECFFGRIDNTNIFSYAPSVGGKYDLSVYGRSQLKALEKLKCITVRDEVTKSFINDAIGKKAELVADPTLLFDWNKFIEDTAVPHKIPNKDYILVYGGFDPKLTNAISLYGKRNNLQIVNVGIYNRRFKNCIAVSPIEFLHFVKKANYVITSMFHGVMLSLAFNKEFRYIAMDPNRDIKLSTILKKLYLENVTIEKNNFDENYDWKYKIDYEEVKPLLNEFRKHSNEILKTMI
ncbi:MAG: polysaccharide pyruvyl transferase family protein [Lachnospiraceae bacterium]|nr:polysaccharide pyruvyl transferase family protein [Lachnospiraceae bacterium]